ncbi:MAG: 2-hydroxychromene-2-carboxylate isomerase [Polyangiaceae bacterium]
MQFFFDYISPYAYVAWHEAQRLAAAHGRPLVPEPIVFAALLNAHGQKGPAEIPSKRAYTFKDAFRKAHRAGLPLAPPPSHPFNPLLALRATLLVPEEERALAVTELFRETWGGGGGIETEDAVRAALERVGLRGAELVQRASDPSTKAELRGKTERAIARGLFGVPTIVVDEELFWGVDGLAFVDAFLKGADPVPADAEARWRDLPASAARIR